MSGSIDWEDLRIGYNRLFKTEYKTVKEMVIELYKTTKSLTAASDILGISRPTFGNKLKVFIPLQGKGGNNHRGTVNKLFLEITPEKMATMTKLEIAKACGNSSDTYTGMLIKKHNRSFIKVLNAGRDYARKARSGSF